MLNLLGLVIIGAFAGYVAGRVFKTWSFGTLGNMAVGIFGAFLGMVFLAFLGGFLAKLAIAFVGTAFLFWLAGKFKTKIKGQG